MKLDVKHLDRLIEEELQIALTEIRDEDLEFARQRSAQAQAQIADVYGQKGPAAPSKTSMFAPYSWPSGEETPTSRFRAPSGASEKAQERFRSQRQADQVVKRIAGATPGVGAAMTMKQAWDDPEAGALEKATRMVAAPAVDVAGAFFPPLGWAEALQTAGTGEAPVDYAIKQSFAPTRAKKHEKEKKHQAQQKQAKAAQDPTARSAARGGLTAAQLDARNKQRLAARGIGGTTSAKDTAAQKAWSSSQLAKTQKKAPTATVSTGQTGGSGEGDIRKEPTYTRRQGSLPLQRESARTNNNMLTENQIRKFQKLANCEAPQKRLITEAVDPLAILLALLGGFIGGEVNAAIRRTINPQWTPGKWDTPIAAIETIWNSLVGTAQSRAKEGDSRLASVINTLESGAEQVAGRLDPNQIAAIQKRFADDEELAALLAQLADVEEEEDYRKVLSQVERHIQSRLGYIT